MNLPTRVLLSSLLVSSAAAFGVKPLVLPTTVKEASEGANGSSSSGSRVWRAPMNMAAGGAERAAQDEYYDGML